MNQSQLRETKEALVSVIEEILKFVFRNCKNFNAFSKFILRQEHKSELNWHEKNIIYADRKWQSI